MKKIFCILAAAAALGLTACSSDDDIWSDIFDDPADFTAATRVEQSSPELPFGGDSSGTDSEDESSEEEKPVIPLNDYGLYDQYFLNSYTYAFNAILAEKHFTCDVTYFSRDEESGKAVKQYSEKNEINGRDRHFMTQLEKGDSELFYDKEIYYIKDVNDVYTAYILDWDDETYTAYDDPEQLAKIQNLDTNIPSELFYGIDDLETAIYLGYLPDEEKGTTVEKFRIEETVYSFTYGEDGILTRAEVDDGRIAKVKNFENSCPPLAIPSNFRFEE